MAVFIIAAVYLVINGIVAYHMKNVAYSKGYDDDASAWAMSFWLGIPGWLYVLALPDLVARKNQEIIIELLTNGNNNAIGEIEQDELPEL